MNNVVLFETLMLITFGLSWPVNISKSLKCKTASGKSVAYEYIVVVGYLFGITAKIMYFLDNGTLQYSFFFYIIDICLVLVDIAIYHRNAKLDKSRAISS